MSKFLEDLKKAADTGEFNSDAAKKINRISDAAETKSTQMSTDELESSLKKRMEDSPAEPVSEMEAVELNAKYEEKMAEIKRVDAANNQLAVLTEIEEMVQASIGDMLKYVMEIENGLGDDLSKNPYLDLRAKIDKIKEKYQ